MKNNSSAIIITILYTLSLIICFTYQQQNQIKFSLLKENFTNNNRNYENIGLVCFDSNIIEYPITSENNVSKNYVRKVEFEINEEMDIISKFIKDRNNRIPKVLCDIISYYIFNNSRDQNIPVEIIVGIIEVESFYNPVEISSKKARGLMQVLDQEVNNEEIDKWRLHEINYNIEYGIKILKSKLRLSKGDIEKALFLYVGKDKGYSDNVFKVIGQYRYFRSQMESNNI